MERRVRHRWRTRPCPRGRSRSQPPVQPHRRSPQPGPGPKGLRRRNPSNRTHPPGSVRSVPALRHIGGRPACAAEPSPSSRSNGHRLRGCRAAARRTPALCRETRFGTRRRSRRAARGERESQYAEPAAAPLQSWASSSPPPAAEERSTPVSVANGTRQTYGTGSAVSSRAITSSAVTSSASAS